MGTRTCSREYYNFRDGKSVLSVLKYDGENPPFYTSYKKFSSKIINNRIKISPLFLTFDLSRIMKNTAKFSRRGSMKWVDTHSRRRRYFWTIVTMIDLKLTFFAPKARKQILGFSERKSEKKVQKKSPSVVVISPRSMGREPNFQLHAALSNLSNILNPSIYRTVLCKN